MAAAFPLDLSFSLQGGRNLSGAPRPSEGERARVRGPEMVRVADDLG